mgnify:CR=1 FL=1
MVNIQFSSNNANTQIKMESYMKKNDALISNNFKCHKADNRIKTKKSVVTLGDRTKLWD